MTRQEERKPVLGATMIAKTVVVLLGLGATAAAGCSTELDCELSGVCVAGACECDLGWSGEHCNQLDLLPNPPGQLAYRDTNDSWASWGSSPPIRTADGTYHLYATRDTDGCPVVPDCKNPITIPSPLRRYDSLPHTPPPPNHVRCSRSHTRTHTRTHGVARPPAAAFCAADTFNMQLVHATSPSLLGPYRLQNVALPQVIINPHVVRAPDGVLVLFYSGEPVPGNLSRKCTGGGQDRLREPPGPKGFINDGCTLSVATAPDVNTPFVNLLTNFTPAGAEQLFCHTNPTAFIFGNGTTMLYFRSAEENGPHTTATQSLTISHAFLSTTTPHTPCAMLCLVSMVTTLSNHP